MEGVNISLSSVMFTSTRPNYRVVGPVASPFLHKYLCFLRLTLFLWILKRIPSLTAWSILMSSVITLDRTFPLIVLSERYAFCVAKISPR